MDAFFVFAINQGKPIIAFSEIYLSYGAAAAIEIDRYAMGSQAGEIANRMLTGVSPADIPSMSPNPLPQNQPQCPAQAWNQLLMRWALPFAIVIQKEL